MKKYLKIGWDYLGKEAGKVQFAIWIALLVGVAGQLFTYSAIVAENSFPRAVVRSFDNDAARAIETLDHTRLYNDNKFNPYGPVYFRVARLLERGVNWPKLKTATQQESYEQERDFFLQLTNFIFLLGLCFALAWMLTEHRLFQILITQILATCFLQNKTWAFMAMRPHPDYALVFMVVIASFFTLRVLHTREESETNWKKSAVLWGIAGATKFTTILFLPALVFANASFPRAMWVKRFVQFFLLAWAGYLVVGFPQSLDFGPFHYHLFRQSNNVIRGSWEFMQVWMGLFGEQMLWPVSAFVLAALFVPGRRSWSLSLARSNWGRWALSFMYVLTPTALLFSREVRPPYDWYPMPFIGMLLVGLVFLLPSFTGFVERAWPRLRQTMSHGAFSIGLFVVWPLFMLGQPTSLQEVALAHQPCIETVRRVKVIIEDEVKAGGNIVADPFIPYSDEINQPRGEGKSTKPIQAHYDLYPDRIEKGKTTLIGLKPSYYARYLPKEEGGTGAYVWARKDLEATRNFYRIFNKKDSTVDQHGQTWQRFFNTCDYELFRRVVVETSAEE